MMKQAISKLIDMFNAILKFTTQSISVFVIVVIKSFIILCKAQKVYFL